VRDIELAADAQFQATHRESAPRGRRRSRSLETPDVVGGMPDSAWGEVP
jgi:hypothetical protein